MKTGSLAARVVMFDVDGTLAKSKRPLDREMARLLARLTQGRLVAIAGGGKFSLFRVQLLRPMAPFRPRRENLRLFTTNSSSLYRYRNGWRPVYRLALSPSEKRAIRAAFRSFLPRVGLESPARVYGSRLEDRGSQITFSALGQRAPLSAKRKWNRTADVRPRLIGILKRALPAFEVHEGGLTSIDITQKGINKGYAVRRLMRLHRLKKNDILFIGDAIFPGGNDYPAKKAGVPCVKVKGPEETKRIIKRILSH